MTHIIGIFSILLVYVVTKMMALRRPEISSILFFAFTIRVFVMLIGHYLIVLPGSTADAQTYERVAWEIAQNGFFSLFDYYSGAGSRFISWIIAIPYSLLGRSVLMAQSISLFLSILCIYLGYKITEILWNKNCAKKVAWLITLFPSLILYSVLIMREVYVCFFLLIAILGVVGWTKNKNLKSIILALFGFAAAAFFHGAIIVGGLIFIIYVGIFSIINFLKSITKLRLNIKFFFIILIAVGISAAYFSNLISVPYLGNFENSLDYNILLRKTFFSTQGNASYPLWTIPTSPNEIIYKGMIRGAYFMFSPFVWDVKSAAHLIGLFDGLLYVYLFILILNNIKLIWKDESLRLIFIILFSYIFIFGIGVGNFGTSVRHRSKFVILFFLLIAYLIKKIIFFKKNV